MGLRDTWKYSTSPFNSVQTVNGPYRVSQVYSILVYFLSVFARIKLGPVCFSSGFCAVYFLLVVMGVWLLVPVQVVDWPIICCWRTLHPIQSLTYLRRCSSQWCSAPVSQNCDSASRYRMETRYWVISPILDLLPLLIIGDYSHGVQCTEYQSYY